MPSYPQPITAAGIYLYTWGQCDVLLGTQPRLNPEPLNQTRLPRMYPRFDHDEKKLFSSK